MPNITEPTPTGRSRPGSWQFPTSSRMQGDGAEQSPHAARLRRGAAEQRDKQLANALGWLSIGVGVANLLAPRVVAKAAGLPAAPLVMRAMGVRELVCGLGLLNQPGSATWRWSRVAGDAADLLMLGVATRAPGSARGRLAATAVVVAGVTVLDVMAGMRSARQASPFGDDPSRQIEQDLYRSKQLVETGEAPAASGQPAGRRGFLARWFNK